jgi:hypothetical protein
MLQSEIRQGEAASGDALCRIDASRSGSDARRRVPPRRRGPTTAKFLSSRNISLAQAEVVVRRHVRGSLAAMVELRRPLGTSTA